MTGMWYHILDKCGMTAQIWRKPKIRKEVKNVKKVLSMVLAVVMLASTLSLCFVSTFTASAEEVAAVDTELEAFIVAKIAERKEAKKAKDFARADAIRDELAAMGITIKDTRQGVQWFRG